MNNIKKLNQLVETWANTDVKNKMDEIQKQIIETQNKIAKYPVELVQMSKSIETLKNREEDMDNYTIIEKYLKLFQRYNIKYNKEINLISPNTDEIIKNIWEIKQKEYTLNPKYETEEVKRIIRELSNQIEVIV